MPQKDVSSSTAMIAGYTQMDMLKGFRKFRVNVIGRYKAKFHNLYQRPPCPCQNMSFGIENGLLSKHREVTNALVTVYAKCRSTDKADVKPDSTTFANVPSASIKMGALEEGVDIH
ncbi:uncharacterized protein LOC131859960 [Cryptomeria japonica]|uniref:uncharacterized protein LOC131859960 n=1 Tax=Cryptomeria japonica TaxID=3369 RepID=UPI0027DA2C0D|nr:uncharacterized protein LOC131859960 [Cryptomeria japonica]